MATLLGEDNASLLTDENGNPIVSEDDAPVIIRPINRFRGSTALVIRKGRRSR